MLRSYFVMVVTCEHLRIKGDSKLGFALLVFSLLMSFSSPVFGRLEFCQVNIGETLDEFMTFTQDFSPEMKVRYESYRLVYLVGINELFLPVGITVLCTYFVYEMALTHSRTVMKME